MRLTRTLFGVVVGIVVTMLLTSAPSAAGVAEADVSVTKSGPTSYSPGANVSFTLVVANAGPFPATNVVLSDVLPAGVTFVSFTQNGGPAATLTTPPAGGSGTVMASWPTLAVEASATFTLVVNVPAGFTGNLLNTATITASTFDPDTADNSSTASVSGTTTTTTSTTMASTTSTTLAGATTTTAAAVPLAVTGGGSTAAPIVAVALLIAGSLIVLVSRGRMPSTRR